MVKVNGENLNIDGRTLFDYLQDAGYDTGRIAVERNGDIVPKAAYEKTVFTNGDIVEVVSFVGGG